jgi:death on curing protein
VKVRILSVEAIEAFQRQSISDHGGSHGLRDRGLLESAAARPENVEHYRPEASVGELAATLAWGLIKNHAFIDGNKRVGLICLVNFLHINGYRLTSSQEEEIAMVLRAAAGEITEEQWTVWVMRVVAPIAK